MPKRKAWELQGRAGVVPALWGIQADTAVPAVHVHPPERTARSQGWKGTKGLWMLLAPSRHALQR